MSIRKIKYFLYRFALPYCGLFLVKIISLTYRIKIIESEIEDEILKTGKSLVYASWHQRFFPGITFFAMRKPIAIMISQSKDGEFISRIVEILGWHPVRGSSSRAGREALEQIRTLALGGCKIGHIVDGPRGPLGVVKPGLLRIAQAAAIPIVPTITSAEKKWILNSWDRFMLPKPFSRVIIRFGSAIHVDPNLNNSDFEEKRLFIEHILKELYDETDLLWKQPMKINRIFNKQ